MSIADALLEQVKRHLPAGAVLRRVDVRAGPMRAIEPEAMRWAWEAVTAGTAYDGATLQLEVMPWRLECPKCERRWEAEDLFEPCTCGDGLGQPQGGDELQLMSLEVDQAAERMERGDGGQ